MKSINHKGSGSPITLKEILLFTVLTVAAVFDLYYYKIPNYLIIIGGILGISFRFLELGWYGGFYWVGGALIPILLYPAYYLHIIGAGDIKLFLVISGAFGIKYFSNTLIYTFLIGAIFSIYHIIKHRNWFQRFSYFFQYISQIIQYKKVMPYYSIEEDGYTGVIPLGVCIVIGAILTKGNPFMK